MSLSGKYDRLADGFSAAEYADPDYYNRRRAQAVFAVGPPLAEGATVLDLGCADASFAPEVLARGYRYVGMDSSAGMRAAAQARVGAAGVIEDGSFDDYEPRQPVDMTVMLRALYLIEDRVELLRRIGGYTRVKVVFDVSAAQLDLAAVEADARAAGFAGFDVRPMLVSTRLAPPALVDAALRALEHSGPLGLAIGKRRFRVCCAAYDFGRRSRSTSRPSNIAGSSSSGT